MRKTTLALVVCSAVALTPIALADDGQSSDTGQTACAASPDQSVADAKRVARAGYAKKKWRDRTPVKPPQRIALIAAKACADDGGRRVIKRIVGKRKSAFHLYRAYRRVAPYRCHGGSQGYYAIPCYVVACESGYSWGADNPSSSAAGPYQLLDTHPRPWPVRGFRDRLRHHQIAAGLSFPAAWDFGCV